MACQMALCKNHLACQAIKAQLWVISRYDALYFVIYVCKVFIFIIFESKLALSYE